jgi:hypothetical protein
VGALRGAFTAVLGLVALETVLSSPQAADRSSGLLTGVAGIIDHALNPAIAAIPNLSGDPTLDVIAGASSTAAPSTPIVVSPGGGSGPPITTKVQPPDTPVDPPGVNTTE